MSAPRHAQHLFEARLAAEDLAQPVLIERLHAVAEPCRLDLAVGGSRLDASAHSIVDDKDFGDAGAATKASVAAGRASDRNGHPPRQRGVGMAGESRLETSP